MKNGFSLRGLRKVLLQRPADADSSDVAGAPALAAFGPLPATEAAGKRGRDLVDFLGQANLFEEFSRADLARLARSAHERNYRDGESIYEQGTPGAALFLVRSGVVEILRRKRNGEEVSVLMLEPPAPPPQKRRPRGSQRRQRARHVPHLAPIYHVIYRYRVHDISHRRVYDRHVLRFQRNRSWLWQRRTGKSARALGL